MSKPNYTPHPDQPNAWIGPGGGMLIGRAGQSLRSLLAEIGNAKERSPDEVMPEQIKAEAERRILAIAPMHRQLNDIAAMQELMAAHGSDASEWPDEAKAQRAAIEARRTAIQTIRDASNALEAVEPAPADYADDKHWIDAQT